MILQATHGIVSGNPSFFKKAFGPTKEAFFDLLLRPHDFLFNRSWYEEHGGKDRFLEFQELYTKLKEDEKKELAELLSSATQ